MNRTDRISAILILLQSKKLITASEISERFNISLRTVYRDMRTLCEAGVPLGSEAGKGYYLVEGYHLPPVMFTVQEAGSMLIAGKLVGKFADQSVKASFSFAVDKIKAVLPETHLEYIGQMEEQVHIFYNNNESSEEFSNDHITTIQLAIAEKKCLEIDYFSSYKKEETTRMIEPLGLCFYGFKWHLISYCRLRKDYRDFRIDRIQKLKISSKNIEHSKGFSIKDYFNKSWLNEELMTVCVRFNKENVSLISNTRYYFGFFEEHIEGNYIEMKFAINEYNYLANWLIGLGSMVQKIMHPKLLQVVKENVKRLNKKYIN